jgi:hypothetical protein
MAGAADAYKTEMELKKIHTAIKELATVVAKIDKRLASLEEAKTAKPK